MRAEQVQAIPLFPVSGAVRGGGELETTAFRLDGRRGSFATAVARLEWNPTPDLNLRLRMPFHSLALEDEVGTRHGPGDAEMRFRLQIRRTDPLKVTVGWVTQLPTGLRQLGLGEGAVQLTPFVNAGYRLDRTIVYVTLADTMSLAGEHRVRLPNYVDPGEDHELKTTLGTLFELTDAVSGSVVLNETTILTNVYRWDSLLTGGAQLGVQPDRRLRLVLSAQVPLLGEHRFTWKLTTVATYAF